MDHSLFQLPSLLPHLLNYEIFLSYQLPPFLALIVRVISIFLLTFIEILNYKVIF